MVCAIPYSLLPNLILNPQLRQSRLNSLFSIPLSWFHHDVYNTTGDGNGLYNLHTLKVLLCIRGRSCHLNHLVWCGISREVHSKAYLAIELDAQLNGTLNQILLIEGGPLSIAYASAVAQSLPQLFCDMWSEGRHQYR